MGKVFYFQPGHETYPIYHQAEIQRIIVNAACWAGSARGDARVQGGSKPLEDVKPEA